MVSAMQDDIFDDIEMLKHFEPGVQAPIGPENAWYFIYSGHAVLGSQHNRQWQPIAQDQYLALSLTPLSQVYMGTLRGIACYGVELAWGFEAPVNHYWTGLRRLLLQTDESLFAIVGRGRQLLEWHRTHQFCGQCGQLMQDHPVDRARQCLSCDKLFYPRLSPCIIVLVTRGEELLLARGAGHSDAVYSTLAGFIEAGETVEQAVHREVMEEVGLELQKPVYQGSQSWPFPHQLMLGFEAAYHSGEIAIDEKEIADARWWHFTELPRHPPEMSISGRLIHNYVQRLIKQRE